MMITNHSMLCSNLQLCVIINMYQKPELLHNRIIIIRALGLFFISDDNRII